MKWLREIPVPTTLTLWLVALGIGTAFLWGWKGAVTFDLGILVLLALDFAKASRAGEVTVERKIKGRFYQGIPQDVDLVLRNSGARAAIIKVRDQTPIEWESAPILTGTVSPRTFLNLSYSVIPLDRGLYRFGEISLRTKGPLGLVLRIKRFNAAEDIKAYPTLQTLRYSDLATHRRVARNWGFRSIRQRGEGQEFDSLREYVLGDDPRKIHWKATARFDRPIVQEFQPEKNQILMILLDAGRLMGALSGGKTKLDHALEAAIHLVQAALSGGDQAGLLAFAENVITFVPPGRTPEQLQAILEKTFSIKPKLVEPHYEKAFMWLRSRIQRRSLVVIFTDILDDLASENLLNAVSLVRPRHLPLCITIRESEWDDLLNSPPSQAKGVYERAVLQETLVQRKRGLLSLVQNGSLAMDLPPSKLSTGVLNQYLEVKRRGLL